MKPINKFFLAIFLSSMTVLANAAAQPSTSAAQPTTSSSGADISGSYNCSGLDPSSNSSFKEIVTFAKTGDTYRMQFYHTDSPNISYALGTAMLNNDPNNAVSYVNWDAGSGGWIGVGIYERKSDGSLDGTWASSGKSVIGTETCTKSK